MNACRPLYEYAWFVQKIRELKADNDDIGDAVGKALESMPEVYLLKPFLKEHMAEVTSMLSAELQEISAKEMIARANFREGEKRGEKRGVKKGLAMLSDVNNWLFSQNRVDDVKKAAEDPEYLEKMLAEYDDFLNNHK